MPWIESRYDGGRCRECSANIYEGDRVWFAGRGEIYCEECSPDAADYPYEAQGKQGKKHDDSGPKVDKDMPIE